MRNYVILFVAACLPSTASAADGFYIRGFGGVSMLQDTDVTSGVTTGPARFDTGSAFGGAVGYDYPGVPWRTELEFAYRGADADSLPAALGTSGDFASTALMLNGLYEFGDLGSTEFYVGAGVGTLTEIDFDFDGSAEFTDRGGLATQLILGAEYAVSERFALTGELRYFNAGSVTLSSGATLLEADYESVDAIFGVKFSF